MSHTDTPAEVVEAAARAGHEEWLAEQETLMANHGDWTFTGVAWDDLSEAGRQRMRDYYAAELRNTASAP